MHLYLPIPALAFCSLAMAQQSPAALTSVDYARAEKFMNYNTTPLVLGVAGRPELMADGRFWYRVTREERLGVSYRRSPERWSARPPRLRSCTAGGGFVRSFRRKVRWSRSSRFQTIEFSDDSKTVSVSATGKRAYGNVHSTITNASRIPACRRRIPGCHLTKKRSRFHPRLQPLGSRCWQRAQRRS